MELPVIHVEEIESTEQVVESTVQVVEDIKGSPKNVSLLVIIIVVLFIVCVILCCILIIKSKKNKMISKQPDEENGETHNIKDANEKKTNDKVNLAKIVLINTTDSNKKYEAFISDFVLIGQQPGVDIVIDDSTVSREHCKIIAKGDQLYLEDCASTNGTVYEGVEVTGQIPISNGGIIEIGRHKYMLMIVGL